MPCTMIFRSQKNMERKGFDCACLIYFEIINGSTGLPFMTNMVIAAAR